MYEEFHNNTLVIRATRFDVTGRGLRDYIYWIHFDRFGLEELVKLTSAITTACLYAYRFPTVQKINADLICRDSVSIDPRYRENFDIVKDCWKMRLHPIGDEYDVSDWAIEKLVKRVVKKFNLL